MPHTECLHLFMHTLGVIYKLMILKAIRALYYIGGAERITDMRQLCVNMKGRDASRVCLMIILHALLCDTIHTSE